jgi:hypothetical protein
MPASGNLQAASMRGFIDEWLAAMPEGERASLVDAEGKLTPQGEMQLRNGILHKAYGDSPEIARMVEATDALSRNLTKAMVKSARDVAETRQSIERGDLYDLDIQPQLLQAYDTLVRLNADDVKLDKWLAENDMYGTGVGPEAVVLMQHFQGAGKSPKAMAELISGYYEHVKALGDPRRAEATDPLPPSRGEILRATLEGKKTPEPAKETVVSTPQDDVHAGQTFASDAKARAYIAKNGIGATHTVKKLRNGEFEIRPRPGAGATMDAAAEKIARQEAAVRQAEENIAGRQAAEQSVEQVLFDQPNARVATEDGESAPASIELDRADEGIARAEEEAPGYTAAAACAARMGT